MRGSPDIVFDRPQSVTLEEHRWRVRIIVVDARGDTHVYIADADSWYAQGSGVWFGTEAEHEAEAP